MKKNIFTHFLCITILPFAPSVFSAERKQQTVKEQGCQLIPSNVAIKRALNKTGGKVVSVKLKRNGAQSVYRVRVLVDDKRIKNISIKACE